jgi:membrane protein YdbS with pleckstrin-like domain
MFMSQSTPPSDPRVTPPAAAPSEEHEPHRPTDDREEVYYEGSPLIRGEIGKFFLLWILGLVLIASPIICRIIWGWWPHWIAMLVLIVAGLLIMWIPMLVIRSVRYRVSNYRIDFERGIFGKKIDTLELWHVEDIRMEQKFIERLLGVGTILVISNDASTPKLPLHGIPHPRPLFESLKQRIIAVKRQRGVVKMDMGGHLDAT